MMVTVHVRRPNYRKLSNEVIATYDVLYTALVVLHWCWNISSAANETAAESPLRCATDEAIEQFHNFNTPNKPIGVGRWCRIRAIHRPIYSDTKMSTSTYSY